MKVNLIIMTFGILVMPFWASAQDVVHTESGYNAVLSQKYEISAGGSLHLNNIAGTIEIEGISGNEVIINESMMMNVFTKDEALLILAESKDQYLVQNSRISVTGSGDDDWVKRNWKIMIPENINLHISSNTGDINIGNMIANVQVTTANGAITVRNVNGNVTTTSAGGSLLVENITGTYKGTTAGGDISIHQVEQNVNLVTAGGNIEITGAFNGGSALTNGGDISLFSAVGTFGLATLGGEINLRNIKGEIKASTSGGEITGTGLNGTLRLETFAGDIKLYQSSAEIEAHTNAGSITLETSFENVNVPHNITLSTNDGDITILIPANLPAQILAKMPNLGSSAGGYNIYSDFVLTNDETDQAIIKQKSAQVNGGGDTISLFTQRGNIYIQQLNR